MDEILPDPEAFRWEWREAIGSVAPGSAGVLDEVALGGRTLADVARERGVSRESVRQAADRCVRGLRDAAHRNPQGALGRAARAMEELSETAAVEAWAYRRLSRAGRDAVAAMLTRLEAIAEDQACLVPAICCLVERPAEPRADLRGMAEDARSVLFSHPSGLCPQDLPGRLKAWQKPMSAWPRLDIARFVTARLDVVVAPDGRMRLTPEGGALALAGMSTAQRLEWALEQAGGCRHVRELVELVRREATAGGRTPARGVLVTAQTAQATLSRDPRFRWAGQGTYGLAEWGVGLSATDLTPGQRPSVRMEIERLLNERGSIPVAELTERLTRRFRVHEKTIRRSIARSPGTEVRQGVLRRTDPNGPRRKGDHGVAPMELLTVDEVKRCQRQVDVLRELAVRNGGMADIVQAAKLVQASGMTTNTCRGVASNLYSHVSRSREWASLGRNRAWLLEFGPAPWEFPE